MEEKGRPWLSKLGVATETTGVVSEWVDWEAPRRWALFCRRKGVGWWMVVTRQVAGGWAAVPPALLSKDKLGPQAPNSPRLGLEGGRGQAGLLACSQRGRDLGRETRLAGRRSRLGRPPCPSRRTPSRSTRASVRERRAWRGAGPRVHTRVRGCQPHPPLSQFIPAPHCGRNCRRVGRQSPLPFPASLAPVGEPGRERPRTCGRRWPVCTREGACAAALA